MLRLKDICVFTRSYRGDIDLLSYLYRSVEKYCRGIENVVLVVEQDDYELVSRAVPSWVQICVERKFAPGTIQHKYSKLTADLHTDREYIFHIDSDSIFFRPLIPEYLSLNDNKPYLEYCSYAHLLALHDSEPKLAELRQYCFDVVLPEQRRVGAFPDWTKWSPEEANVWFRDWYAEWKLNFGVDIWREGTSVAMGQKVDYEFSRRPEKLYPRELYRRARLHLEKQQGVSVQEFLSTRIGIQTLGASRQRYFSDLNFLGAYLYYFMNDAITWIDTERLGKEYRPTFVKQFISYDILEKGRLKEDTRREIESLLSR